MPIWEQLGMQAAGALTGAIFGNIADHRQRKQQRKLQEIEIEGQKQMTDYNMEKQLEMWENTNYSAQKEQLVKAGLNPGLLYGMSGGGGVTTGNASGNVTGGHAPSGGGELMGAAQLALQMAAQTELLKAQKENIEADTRKKNVEATKTEGIDTEEATARTASLAQGIENQQAQIMLTNAETNLKKIQASWETETFDARIEQIDRIVEKLTEEAKGINIANASEKELITTKIDIAKTELAGLYLKNALTEAQTNLTKEQKMLAWKQWESLVNAKHMGWAHIENESRKIMKDAGIDDNTIKKTLEGIETIMGTAKTFK